MSILKSEFKKIGTGRKIIRYAFMITAAVLLFVTVMGGLWLGSRYYVLNKAERDIETMLLQHKGVHHYVQRNAHPELYSLKKNKNIPGALYSPVLFSSTYMVRNMHDYYNDEREKAGLARLYYKMAAENPRNPVNMASEFEAELIRMFNEKDILSYRIIEEYEGEKYLYVAIPFLRNDKSCMKCHGKYEDSPKQLQTLYPGRGGFNEEIGYIRAIESLRAPLTGELAFPYMLISSAGVVLSVILTLLFFNRRLGSAVAERTVVIKQQADTLKGREEKLRITLKSIGEGVISSDVEGRIIRMNPVAEHLTGWSESEGKGEPLEKVFLLKKAEYTDLQDSIDEKTADQGEGVYNHRTLISRDEIERKISMNSAPIRSDRGETVGAVLVFRDITEQIVMQKRLHQSQKMDAIGQLAGGIAHDFNNMLGGIIGASEVLSNRMGSDEKSLKFVNILLDSAKRAAGLTRELMVFSRESNFEQIVVDVHSAVKDAVVLLESSIDKRISICTELGAERSNCQGNSTQLENIFLNLGINAADAMTEGGTLTFLSSVEDLDDVYCSTSSFNVNPGPYIVVEVRDTGVGMEQYVASRIFEPFFTTKPAGRGTGLGLASVYGAVEQHRGAITVYSEPGRGTIFHIAFPLTHELPVELSESERISGEGLILVVDDEEGIRYTAQDILTSLGYDVLLASDGAEALNVLKNNINRIDLVLLDMIMPNMNGAECFDELRSLRPDIPIVISSGFTNGIDFDDLRNRGHCSFMRKPYYTTALSRIISDLLQKSILS